jgi:two-component system, NarL family, sensor histidine kinase UhpB
MTKGRQSPSAAPRLLDAAANAKADRRLPIFWRAFIASALVMVGAALALTFAPIEIDAPIKPSQLLLVLSGLALMLLINLWALWRVLAPLRRLRTLMTRIDPEQPGQRITGLGSYGPDVAALSVAFNEMLDRLERERRESARLALAAQERERQRVASELHDEIGQSLTAAAIQIERAAGSPDPGRDLGGVADIVRSSLDEVRRIARELRPEALDDLGLINALISLCSRAAVQGRLRIERRLAAIPPRSSELDLVIYRVAQESLTNVVRHAEASSAVVALVPVEGRAVLSVADDGRGLPARLPDDSAGISGMRERARFVNAELKIESTPGLGTTVTLDVPIERSNADPA